MLNLQENWRYKKKKKLFFLNWTFDLVFSVIRFINHAVMQFGLQRRSNDRMVNLRSVTLHEAKEDQNLADASIQNQKENGF